MNNCANSKSQKCKITNSSSRKTSKHRAAAAVAESNRQNIGKVGKRPFGKSHKIQRKQRIIDKKLQARSSSGGKTGAVTRDKNEEAANASG